MTQIYLQCWLGLNTVDSKHCSKCSKNQNANHISMTSLFLTISTDPQLKNRVFPKQFRYNSIGRCFTVCWTSIIITLYYFEIFQIAFAIILKLHWFPLLNFRLHKKKTFHEVASSLSSLILETFRFFVTFHSFSS